jgi:hypothetical protein
VVEHNPNPRPEDTIHVPVFGGEDSGDIEAIYSSGLQSFIFVKTEPFHSFDIQLFLLGC